VVPLKIEGRKWRERESEYETKEIPREKSEGREEGEGKKLLNSKRESYI
jgi:hypothetical protein